MTPRDFARCIEMAFNGTKSAYPAMQPADAFLRICRSWCARWSPAPSARRRNRARPKQHLQKIRSARKIWRSQMSTMTINGRLAPLPDDLDALLIDVIRDDLGLTGTNSSAGPASAAPAPCWSMAQPVASCLMPASAATDKSVTTVEGIGAARCIRCRRPSWRTTPCNAGSARRASSSRPRRFTTAGGRPRERRRLARGNRRSAVGTSVPLRRL